MITAYYGRSYIQGILPKGPYPPCLRMADRALLAGYPRHLIALAAFHHHQLLVCPNTTWLPARWASGFSGDHQQDHQCLWLLLCYSFVLSFIACILNIILNKITTTTTTTTTTTWHDLFQSWEQMNILAWPRLIWTWTHILPYTSCVFSISLSIAGFIIFVSEYGRNVHKSKTTKYRWFQTFIVCFCYLIDVTVLHMNLSPTKVFNTLRPRQMDAISQTTFSNAFSWTKMLEFGLNFHWSLFRRVQLTIFQQWFRQWLGAVQATSHYLNQWWLVYRRIYASLGLNEFNWAIWIIIRKQNFEQNRYLYKDSNHGFMDCVWNGYKIIYLPNPIPSAKRPVLYGDWIKRLK